MVINKLLASGYSIKARRRRKRTPTTTYHYYSTPHTLSFLYCLYLSAAVSVGNLEGSVVAVSAVAVLYNNTIGTAVIDNVEEDSTTRGVLAGSSSSGGESSLVVAY